MIEINHPQVSAEVRAAFEAYEAALVANDVPALQNFFWDSPNACRFGVTEQLYGHAEIAAFRQNRIVNFKRREAIKLSITTFSNFFASAMYEYKANISGIDKEGRQSQTWIKIGNEWKIAAAHVSLMKTDSETLEANLESFQAMNLYPDPAWMDRIQCNYQTTTELAEKLMSFDLTEHTEPAPVFVP